MNLLQRYFITTFALGVTFSQNMLAQEGAATKNHRPPISVQLKSGLFGLGIEAEVGLPQPQNSLFINSQTEGFLLIGSWSTTMLGLKKYYDDDLYIKYGCGWYATETFGSVSRYGPSISVALGWKWAKPNFYWGFEAGGIGVNYLLSDGNFSGYVHVPSLFIGKVF